MSKKYQHVPGFWIKGIGVIYGGESLVNGILAWKKYIWELENCKFEGKKVWLEFDYHYTLEEKKE